MAGTCGHRLAVRVWNGRAVCTRCWNRAVAKVEPHARPAAAAPAPRSQTQIDALAELTGGKLTAFEAGIRVGRSYRRTLAALEARGLVHWYPFARGGQGAWGLTWDGRATVAALLAAGVLERQPLPRL